MKVTNAAFISVALVAATGCMNTQRAADRQQGGTAPEFESTTARATAPSEAELPLNNVERSDKLIGEQVLTSDNQRTGKIEDFVVDENSGHILYAIVGIGGVLGVGETRVAVPPALFTQAKKGIVQLNVDKQKLTRAPQITKDLDKTLKPDFLNNVYGYYSQPATWNRATGSATASLGNARKVSELTGMKVVNNAQQDIGKIETIVLNVPAGREMYVVLAPASDMNLGNDYYALPPQSLKLSTDQKTLVADVTREKLTNAPHFAKEDWSHLSDTAWAHKVYEYYGQPASFQTRDIQPTGRTIQDSSAYPKR